MRENKWIEPIVKAVDFSKGTEIKVLYIEPRSSVADYFVLCSAMNRNHAQAIAQKVDEEMNKIGVDYLREEGAKEGEWILLDYGDVVVQIFQNEARQYYDLDKLWGDAEEVDISSWLIPE